MINVPSLTNATLSLKIICSAYDGKKEIITLVYRHYITPSCKRPC